MRPPTLDTLLFLQVLCLWDRFLPLALCLTRSGFSLEDLDLLSRLFTKVETDLFWVVGLATPVICISLNWIILGLLASVIAFGSTAWQSLTVTSEPIKVGETQFGMF